MPLPSFTSSCDFASSREHGITPTHSSRAETGYIRLATSLWTISRSLGRHDCVTFHSPPIFDRSTSSLESCWVHIVKWMCCQQIFNHLSATLHIAKGQSWSALLRPLTSKSCSIFLLIPIRGCDYANTLPKILEHFLVHECFAYVLEFDAGLLLWPSLHHRSHDINFGEDEKWN